MQVHREETNPSLLLGGGVGVRRGLGCSDVSPPEPCSLLYSMQLDLDAPGNNTNSSRF